MKTVWAMMLAVVMMGSVAAQADVTISDGYVREMPPGQTNTAAFMRLVNSGSKLVEIVGAETSRAARVELHQHIHANGMMRMQPVASVSVPAGGEFVFKSGGYHVMLLDVKPAVKAGESVSLVLVTADGKRLAAELPVKPIVAESDHSKHQHHGHH